MRTSALGPRSLTRNGRFRLAGVLGEGASGVVYRARDREIAADVALKALRSLEPAHFPQLKAEFRALAGITHPNLIQLHELFVDGPECYFTMDLIAGAPFTAALRNDAGVDFPRVRRAARQLALGLTTIHRGGMLHRDIKPTNVLVDASGHVVILDFGLTTSFHGAPVGTLAGPVGTAAYMAPEQGAAAASPAQDWYAVGVVLFEALTGRLPFDGSFYEVLEQKRCAAPPSPRAIDDTIPTDLDDLVTRLLSTDPAGRARAEDVLAIAEHGTLAPRTAAPSSLPFVGRVDELDRLARARAQASAERRPVVVRVIGQSGIGKTETVRRFVTRLRDNPRALVLEGRCHPLESVPYKTLDAVVDGLGRYLATLPRSRIDTLRPAETGALLRVFPSLARPLGGAASPVDRQSGLQEQRSRAFAAFRELLERVADQRELTIWIDDLQWGDVDSLLGLREVLLGSQPSPVLLVASFRFEQEPAAQALRAAESLFLALPPERVHTIGLEPLDPAASQHLAQALCDAHGVHEKHAIQSIAVEASGIPFFVGAMAQRRADTGEVAGIAMGLTQLVSARIGELSERERRLVEVIAVAGGPVAREVAIEASSSGGAGKLDLLRLGHGNLVRPTELREQSAVEMYHDRIREAVLAELPPARRRATHLRLADTLRKDDAVDPEVLVRHYQQAGDDERTGEHAERAADRAASALAFERAAELYQLALKVRPDPELHSRLAESLANAGRGVDAASAFGGAADALAARDPADPRVLLYRRRQGEHFLRSGRLAEGTRCFERVASAVGFAIPRSPRLAMLQAGLRRVRLLVRGIASRPPVHPVPTARLDRIDALWGSSTSISMLDYVAADALGVQHLLEALAAGEPSRIIRGLGYEAAFEAILGGPFFRRRCARIVGAMERLAAETDQPYNLAWARMSRGITAWFHGQWEHAVAGCDEAAALYRRDCRGIAWELAITDAYGLPSLAYLGRLAELTRRVPRALDAADARGDLFAANTCRLGQQNLVYLCADRPDDALRTAHEGISPFPRDRYLIPHYHFLLAVTQASTYAGDAAAAWRFVEEDWPRLRTSQLLRAQFVRIELRHLRARAALGLAASRKTAEPSVTARLLAIARREARTIAADSLPVAAPFAASLRAGIRSVRGDVEGAVRQLAIAADGFDRTGMRLFAEAARHQSGRLRGGVEGAAERQAASAWMLSEGVQSPARMAAMLAPI